MVATKRKSAAAEAATAPNSKKKRVASAAGVAAATAATDRPRRSAAKNDAAHGTAATKDATSHAKRKGQAEGDDVKPSTAAKSALKSAPKRARKSEASAPEPSTTEAAAAPAAKATTKAKSTTESAGSAAAPSNEKPAAAKSASSAAGHERAPDEACFWLMKAEPESRLEKGIDVKFSIDDLAARTEPEPWDGVRNPAAQKNMRTMYEGDLAFFYHSNCKVPGIAGLMRIVRAHSVDESAFDPKHPYYDPKSDRAKPRWCVVHVEHLRTFDELIPLKELQKHAGSSDALKDMQVLRMSRLSVSRVSPPEWAYILRELVGIDPKQAWHKA